MDTTLSRPPAGQLLDGRYRVEAWLAHGGMATVYLGTDTRLDRAVALKIAHPELAGDEEFIRRFIGEAHSVARLSSPHVVAVYDQGTDGQFLYLAMEYVPGRTLRELLKERGRLSPREALDIIEGVLAGLAAAHEAGIVHRDVKPENVLLTNSGLVKVADFGLARAAAAASRTKTGMIIGTAAYLAPEQVSRSSSDTRTDVYATGIMMFELLTGAQPHTGGTPLDVAYKHVNDVVRAPSSLVPGLPPALDALVALATSRNPELRPADASQFLHAITEVRRGMPIGSLRPSGQHARGNGNRSDLATGESSPAGSMPGGSWPGGGSMSGESSPAGSMPGGPLPGGSIPGGPLPGGGSMPPGSIPGGFPPAGSGSFASGPAADPYPPASPHPAGQYAAGDLYPAGGQYSAGAPLAPSDPLSGGSSLPPDGSLPRGGTYLGADALDPGSSPAGGAHRAGDPYAGTDPHSAAYPPPAAGAHSATGVHSAPGAHSATAGMQSPAASSTWPAGGQAWPEPGSSGGQPGGPGSAGQALALPAAVPAVPFPWTNGPGGPADFVPPARVHSGQQGAANHTLIVTPGNLVTDSRPDLNRYRSRRNRDYRRSGEPLLQRLLFSRKVIYLGGGLAAILAIVLVTWWLTSGQYATVPKVYGMSASVARTELTNLGFVVKTGAGQHSNLPKGEVLLTKPTVGTKASQGSTVLLVASLGPVQIPVPQVTGMSLAQAQAALRKAGLTPGQVTTAPSQTIPADIVISTTPVAGTAWPKPKPVGLTVSAGLPLPNFVGQQLAAAQAAAASGGYAVNPVNDPKSEDPAGTITSQSPAANTPITPNEVVTVHVSLGPQQVNIPDVTGLSVDHAKQELEEAGFQVTVNEVSPGHHVISYSPVGQAAQGATITLTVGFILNLP